MEVDKATLRKRMDRIWELSQWAADLFRRLPLAEVIEAVDARRRKADDDDYYTLTSELESLLSLAGRDDEANRVIDEMIVRLPDDVRFPMAKANLHLYFMEDPDRALEAIDLALVRAHRTKFFRREALGVKARILLKLGRGAELTRTLVEIMSLEMKREIPDIGRERDFADRAPPGMIAEDVLARYNVFCPRRDQNQGRSSWDEPPEWSPRDDD